MPSRGNREIDSERNQGIRRKVIGMRFEVALLAIGSTLACSPVETAITAQPGIEFAIPLGKTAIVSGTDVRITFSAVREDSRCPTDVTCVWAGDAKIALVISRAASAEEGRIISLSPPNNESVSNNLRIRFVALAPAPRQADHNPRPYVAQLVVAPIAPN
jgi:hypothetical protein